MSSFKVGIEVAKAQQTKPISALKGYGTMLGCTQNTPTVFGLSLGRNEGKALRSIQRLMDDVNYKGYRTEEISSDENPYRITDDLPVFRFDRSAFYKTFGATYRNEKNEALNSLRTLSEKRSWLYEEVIRGDGSKDIRVIPHTVLDARFEWEALNQDESKQVESNPFEESKADGKAYITLRPGPLLVKGIKNYFIKLPNDLDAQIAKALGRSNYPACIPLLIQFLHVEAEIERKRKKNPIVRRRLETLADAIQLGDYRLQRKIKRCKVLIEEALKVAKKLGFIIDYAIAPGKSKVDVYSMTLNPEKFGWNK